MNPKSKWRVSYRDEYKHFSSLPPCTQEVCWFFFYLVWGEEKERSGEKTPRYGFSMWHIVWPSQTTTSDCYFLRLDFRLNFSFPMSFIVTISFTFACIHFSAAPYGRVLISTPNYPSLILCAWPNCAVAIGKIEGLHLCCKLTPADSSVLVILLCHAECFV